jgi:signal peptidase I
MASTEAQAPVFLSAEAGAPGEQAGAVARRAASSWRSRLLTGVIVLGGLTVLMLGIAIRVGNLHIQTVLSNSMQPTFSAGDLVVTQPVATGAVAVGDVITFIPPNGTRPVIHRIRTLVDGVITTRGDANSVDDAWRVSLTGATTDRLVAVVPYLGWLSQLERPVLILAGAFFGLAVLFELGKEVGARRRTKQTRPQS